MWFLTLRPLLACRGFVRFWMARLLGVMSNQMLMVAVGWQMYDLTGSAWDLGLVGLFQFVPALALTLPAGQVVDRHHRGRIFAASLGLQVLGAAGLVGASALGQTDRGLILAVSVLLGVARAFQMPAQQALTPLLVPPALLTQAITVSTAGMQFAIISGPALGGFIYLAGPSAVYTVCAVCLAVAALLTLGIRYDHAPAPQARGWRHLLGGLGFVWRQKVLLGAISLDLFAVLLGGAVALLPIYAKDILHTGPAGLGVLRAAPSVGALVMSLALIRWPLQHKVGHVLLWAVAVFGLATVVFGVSTRFWLSVVALTVTGAADSVSVVIRMTVMQLETPNELRGRVSAVNSIFIGASNQLGEFESGAAAALLGPVGAVVLGGVGTMLVAASWTRLFPALAQRDRM
jgi:MFS family permease